MRRDEVVLEAIVLDDRGEMACDVDCDHVCRDVLLERYGMRHSFLGRRGVDCMDSHLALLGAIGLVSAACRMRRLCRESARLAHMDEVEIVDRIDRGAGMGSLAELEDVLIEASGHVRDMSEEESVVEEFLVVTMLLDPCLRQGVL